MDKELTESPKSEFLGLMERLITSPDVDVEKIQQVMDMRKQDFDREAKQAFNAAMCKAQNKIELVVATKKNDQTHSFYADLKTILIKTKEIYTGEGFSLMFYEGKTEKPSHTRVCVDVMHEQGHTETRYADIAVQTTGIAGKAMMTQIHAEGSAISYGRRYLTCMIFNIPTGDEMDDDGNGAGGTVKCIDTKQVAEIEKKIKEVKADKGKFLLFMEADGLEKILECDYSKAIEALNDKKNAK